MKADLKNWLDSAQYDLETAEQMAGAGRYIYTVFMCHLALEKLLKARVLETTGKTPPKTHDLSYLVSLSHLSPAEEVKNILAEISNLSVVTRYPTDFQKMHKDFSRERAESILARTTEVFLWIRKHIK